MRLVVLSEEEKRSVLTECHNNPGLEITVASEALKTGLLLDTIGLQLSRM